MGHLHYLQEVYRVVFEERAATTDLLGEELVMCYPLGKLDLARANAAYGRCKEFEGTSLQWRSLEELSMLPQREQELLARYARVESDGERLKDRPVDYAIMQCDDREHCMHLDSAIFNGQFYRPGHKWQVYKAFES